MAGMSRPITRNLLLLLAAALLHPAAAAAQEPPHVRAAREAPLPAALPSESPGDWRLAFIDVETTGLTPGYHEMIDIGLVITDLEGRELSRLFLRIQPDRPERTETGAVRVNGFDPVLWETFGAVGPAVAVDSIIAFCRAAAEGRDLLLTAFNCQFDTAFLDHLFRSQGRSWRELFYYYVLDLPSMAWGLGVRDLQGGRLARRFSVPEETHDPLEHTGLTGAEFNAALYRAMLAGAGNGEPAPGGPEE